MAVILVFFLCILLQGITVNFSRRVRMCFTVSSYHEVLYEVLISLRYQVLQFKGTIQFSTMFCNCA